MLPNRCNIILKIFSCLKRYFTTKKTKKQNVKFNFLKFKNRYIVVLTIIVTGVGVNTILQSSLENEKKKKKLTLVMRNPSKSTPSNQKQTEVH